MTTLALKRKYKGEYFVENNQVLIRLLNCFSLTGIGPNSWEIIIEDKNSGKELLHEWFETKKSASKFGANWVIENL